MHDSHNTHARTRVETHRDVQNHHIGNCLFTSECKHGPATWQSPPAASGNAQQTPPSSQMTRPRRGTLLAALYSCALPLCRRSRPCLLCCVSLASVHAVCSGATVPHEWILMHCCGSMSMYSGDGAPSSCTAAVASSPAGLATVGVMVLVLSSVMWIK
jgi:hypothetical protein